MALTSSSIRDIDENVMRGLSAEAGYEGISRNELMVRILTDAEKRLRADRLTWEQRKNELSAWDDNALESRSDYLFTQYEERSLSPDDDRELRFINRLLNERAEAEDAKAIAA